MTLVAWPWAENQGESGRDRVVVADGLGIVVGDRGQLVWVREHGCTLTSVEGLGTLAAAEPDVAWFADMSFVDAGNPPAPPPPLSPGWIVAVRRDGLSTQITAPAPVHNLVIRDVDMLVTIAKPPVAHALGHESWSFEYPSAVLRVARDRLLTHGLGGTVAETDEVPRAGLSEPGSWSWMSDDPNIVLRSGVRAGGLVWWAGAALGESAINRRVLVVGHDPVTGQPKVRIDLGLGLVDAAVAIGDELWLTVARRRFLAVPQDRGVEVVAVSAAGAVRTIHRPDSVDISRYGPHLRRPTDEQIRHHIEEVSSKFSNLENYWHSPDGATSPLCGGLSDASVSIEGQWPDSCVVVMMRHRSRPGLILRRTLQLFDDGGSPIQHPHPDIDLMEDLDTNYLAPAYEAVDGVLET